MILKINQNQNDKTKKIVILTLLSKNRWDRINSLLDDQSGSCKKRYTTCLFNSSKKINQNEPKTDEKSNNDYGF